MTRVLGKSGGKRGGLLCTQLGDGGGVTQPSAGGTLRAGCRGPRLAVLQ